MGSGDQPCYPVTLKGCVERLRAEKPLEDAVLAKRFEILANAAVFAKS